MREIQASDAKARLPQLLDDVERGETTPFAEHGGELVAGFILTGGMAKQGIENGYRDYALRGSKLIQARSICLSIRSVDIIVLHVSRMAIYRQGSAFRLDLLNGRASRRQLCTSGAPTTQSERDSAEKKLSTAFRTPWGWTKRGNPRQLKTFRPSRNFRQGSTATGW